MKIRQSHWLALSIFTMIITISFVAEAVAGNNPETDSRRSDGSGNNGTDGKGKNSKGDDNRQTQGDRRGFRPGDVDKYIESLFGSLFMVADPLSQIPTMLVNIPNENVFMAESEGKDGQPATEEEPGREPTTDPEGESGVKRVRRPGATIGDRSDLERLLRWGHLHAASQNGVTVISPDSTQGMSEWGKEALRRLREQGSGHLPPENWEPNSGAEVEKPQDLVVVSFGEGLINNPNPNQEQFPPLIYLMDYPLNNEKEVYIPEIGVDKTLILNSVKNIPQLEIGYIPFYTDAPATIGGPEDARNVALLAGVITFLITAAKTIPQVAQAIASGIPVFMVMPDEDGMLMIQGHKDRPRPKV